MSLHDSLQKSCKSQHCAGITPTLCKDYINHKDKTLKDAEKIWVKNFIKVNPTWKEDDIVACTNLITEGKKLLDTCCHPQSSPHQPSHEPSPSHQPSLSSSLSGIAITGIVGGSVLVVLLTVIVIIYLIRKKHANLL